MGRVRVDTIFFPWSKNPYLYPYFSFGFGLGNGLGSDFVRSSEDYGVAWSSNGGGWWWLLICLFGGFLVDEKIGKIELGFSSLLRMKICVFIIVLGSNFIEEFCCVDQG